MDGTLTYTTRRLDLEAVEALREAEDAGVPVVLATGNVLPIVYSLAYFIGTTGAIVAENGGLVLYQGVIEQLGDPAAAGRAAKQVERRLRLTRLFTDRWRVTEVAYPEARGTLEAVRKAVREAGLSNAVRVERTGFAVHLMSPGTSKFAGVQRALQRMGHFPDDAIAMGDSDNDRSMIEGCRVGVALGNASPRLKAAADFVASRPRGAGIREALERYRVLKLNRREGAASSRSPTRKK